MDLSISSKHLLFLSLSKDTTLSNEEQLTTSLKASSIHFAPNTPHQRMWHESPKVYIVMMPKLTLPRLK